MNNYSKYIDHSPLKMEASESEIVKFCNEAIQYSFHAIVVFPYYIETAKKVIESSNVKLETVAGFPFGNDLLEIKAKQTELYMALGVDEIDMVMNLSAFKSGKIDDVKRDIDAVLQKVKAKNGLLKVILEVEHLTEDEIVEACNIVASVGADYVKTSVGLLRGSKPAEVSTVKLMYDTVSSKGLKVKASGGIHTTEKFLAMIEVGASRVGTSKGIELLTGIKDKNNQTEY
jgi:deoxyribose-phosphate aldolase